MPCVTAANDPAVEIADNPTPHSNVSAFLVERQYQRLGCDRWNSRRVVEVMAKLNATPVVMAARMRIRPGDFQRRLQADCWTKQDGLILTLLNREVDFIRGNCAMPPVFIV